MCKLLKSDPKLQNGFNAVGFSQGGQFLRAYVERAIHLNFTYVPYSSGCNDPPVKNLVSIGGQHQGVYGLPHCPGPNSTLCEWMREAIDLGVYLSAVQSYVVQAEYWQVSQWKLF